MSLPCPKCGGRMSITNTAGVESNRTYLLGRINPFINWYSDEFVARDRRCTVCGHALLTVELDIQDLVGMLRYAKVDGPALTQSIIDWAKHINDFHEDRQNKEDGVATERKTTPSKRNKRRRK